MKRHLLFAFALFFSGTISAQTVLFEDNFDSYTVDMGVAAQSSNWDTWAGSSATDGMVVNNITAFSGSNCAKIEGQGTDMVLPIGPFTTGKYDIKWMMYIPTGQGAYFNAMHQWSSNSTTYQWACDVFVAADGSTTWTVEGTNAGSINLPLDTWFAVQITSDLDSDIGKIYFDGVAVVEWQWSINNANGGAGLNQLAGVDFYGASGADGTGEGLYYIDDVQLVESTAVGVSNLNSKQASIVAYPSPANESAIILLDDTWVGGQVIILDWMGKAVFSNTVTKSTLKQMIDVNSYASGIYLIKVSKGSNNYTSKLVVRH